MPICMQPPERCQLHHVTGDLWTLICSYHHRWEPIHGWRAVLVDGRVGWIQPGVREGKPVLNPYHHIGPPPWAE